jgi:hypothetical protein
MQLNVKVKGQEKLLRHLRKLNEPKKIFDTTIAKVARQSSRRLIKTTPGTGASGVSRGWSLPKKLALGKYLVENAVLTQDKKHAIADILDRGRGVVLPVKAKRLYIPLTNKAKSKVAGKKIPKGLIFGIDYVLAKKAKAYKGTKYIQRETKKASIILTKAIIKKIRSVFKR